MVVLFHNFEFLSHSFVSTQTAREWTIYPWIHSNCNSLSDNDQLRPVTFPDMHPARYSYSAVCCCRCCWVFFFKLGKGWLLLKRITKRSTKNTPLKKRKEVQRIPGKAINIGRITLYPTLTKHDNYKIRIDTQTFLTPLVYPMNLLCTLPIYQEAEILLGWKRTRTHLIK